MYVLNVAEDNRILSAGRISDGVTYGDMLIVDELPTGETEKEKDPTNWLYKDGEYIYSPKPDPLPEEAYV